MTNFLVPYGIKRRYGTAEKKPEELQSSQRGHEFHDEPGMNPTWL